MGNLSSKSITRLRAVVRKVEAEPTTLGNKRAPVNFQNGFWARITGVNNTTGGHSWARMVWQPDVATAALSDHPEGQTGTENAFDVNGCRVTAGTRVWMEFAGINEDDEPQYRFDRMPRSGLFAVKVVKTSGSAGTVSTMCSFVYTVKTLDGTAIGTGMTPAKRRAAAGPYSAPADDSYGTAFYDEDGDLVLFDANEVEAVVAC